MKITSQMPTQQQTVGAPVIVVLMNGTVHNMNGNDASFDRGRVKVELILYDAPLLVARSDALPRFVTSDSQTIPNEI